MEVLFEYKDSRCLLKGDSTEAIFDLIVNEFKKYEPETTIVSGVSGEDSGAGYYLLQRWSEKWGYVNASFADDITEGDKLTVVKKPSSETEVLFFIVAITTSHLVWIIFFITCIICSIP